LKKYYFTIFLQNVNIIKLYLFLKICKRLLIINLEDIFIMTYKISAKNRKLKRSLTNIISFLKFESLNSNPYNKIIIFWVVLVFISLYLNWIEIINWDYFNSFNKILWITWYLLLIINLKILFILFNQKIKDFLKNILSINVKDSFLILILWIFLLILNINSVFIIEWLSYFMQWISLWKWIILSVVWSIFIIIWAMLSLKSKTNITAYIGQDDIDINNINNNEELSSDNKNNMKLPF